MSLLHQIALTKVTGIGPVLGRHLISHFGSAEAVFAASKKERMAIPGIGHRLADAIGEADVFHEAEKELCFVEKHHIQILSWDDKGYPKRLADCPDAPLLLYFKGNTDLNAPRIISIVGTRNATSYGKSICTAFIEALLPYNVTIISGLAHGIDSHAHRNALGHGIPTVGVLGHGLDRIYPATNREMAAKMLDRGGLLTEFPSGTNPDKQNFPMRNRIIAGLADVTIVVEAAAKGGALITAEIANTYNRDVCAFPGNLNQDFSAGCNYLIKTHRAHMITSAKDLEYLMNWEVEVSPPESKQLQLPISLDASEQQVYETIQAAGTLAIDDLSLHLRWPQSKLAITLLEMELKGVIVALPGKVYRIQ
ncbi:DNA-processing protein DprA [Parapedobacter sp. DT-150]|uniref:DNA-processing protein DprA n=1 Tax=Parapedobacter sp. DT-150 TaxID=3396162 RepID=UPI003F1B8A25